MEKMVINHGAVWVLVILHQALPAVWYAPAVFGKRWMAHAGLKTEDFAQAHWIQYPASILGSALTCYLTAWLFRELQISTLGKGLLLGLVLGLVFSAWKGLVQNLFHLRPLGLTLINESLTLILFLLTGALLVGWTKHAA